MKYSVSGCHQA